MTITGWMDRRVGNRAVDAYPLARLDTPLERLAPGAIGGAGMSAALGAAVFAAIALVATMPGPGGVIAIVLAAGALGALGMKLLE